MVYLLAIGAAVLFGIGTVVQQHAAAQAPPQDVMSVKLLLWLVRRRLWLVGVATAAVGNVLSAGALGRGSIALVEPLLVVRLLVALPLAAAWQRTRAPIRDWFGAVATAVGLAAFVVAGSPSQASSEHASDLTWAIAGGLIVGISALLAAVGRRLHAVRQAPMLAAGAGLLFALQAALTSTTVRMIGHPADLFTSWYVYGVVVAALGGTLFIQSAYELAPLPASFPAQVTAEPLCGIALGVIVLDGSIRLTPLSLAGELAGLAIMVAGIFVLARSPLVTGQLLRIRQREEQGEAYRAERELVRCLDVLHKDLAHWQQASHERHVERDRQRLRHELHHLERELGRLSALLADLDKLHDAVPDLTGLAASSAMQRVSGPLRETVGTDVVRADEDLLRTRATQLSARAAELCTRAESLLDDDPSDRAAS